MSGHPIKYEHIGILLTIALGLWILASAIMYWSGGARAEAPQYVPEGFEMVCYNLDGTGPVAKCDALIKCYMHRDGRTGNQGIDEVACPWW